MLFSRQVLSDSSATPWTVARQAPLSMGFPRQEYWSGLPSPSPGDLPDSGIKLASPAWQADSLPLSHQEHSKVNHYSTFTVLYMYSTVHHYNSFSKVNHTYIHSFLRFFPHVGHCRVLSRVPYAGQ